MPSAPEEEDLHEKYGLPHKVPGPGPVPKKWERNIRNAEMPEEMLDIWRQHNRRDIPLTPELMKFFTLLRS
eukprot:5079158-Karenia_brevis.AAC.1